jgi:hypothetical protein
MIGSDSREWRSTPPPHTEPARELGRETSCCWGGGENALGKFSEGTGNISLVIKAKFKNQTRSTGTPDAGTGAFSCRILLKQQIWNQIM